MTFWKVVATAIAMFSTTNIDDALLLVVFFANAIEGKDGMSKRHVWLGQTVGFTGILVLTLIGTSVGSLLPPKYTGLLGFIPILMGLWRMRVWCEKDDAEDEDDGETMHKRKETLHSVEVVVEGGPLSPAPYQDHKTPKAPTNSPAVDGVETSIVGVVEDTARSSGRLESTQVDAEVTSETADKTVDGWGSRCLAAIFSVHTVKVIAATLANAGDNVAVYIPVLVTYNVSEIVLTIVVFYVMLVLWLLITSAFVSFRYVAVTIDKYGDYILPVALVLIGVYILWSANTIELVCSSC